MTYLVTDNRLSASPPIDNPHKSFNNPATGGCHSRRINTCASIMPPRTLKGALIMFLPRTLRESLLILLVGAAASKLDDLRVDRRRPRGPRVLRCNRRHGGVVGFEIDLPPDYRKHWKNPAPRVSGSAVRRAGRRLVNTLSTLKASASSAARASRHHHSRRARIQPKRPPG